MTQKSAATELRTFRTFLLMQQFAAREIGERIALARREAGGMTQEHLAELLNVSKRSLQDYEAGSTIPYRHMNALAEIFQKSVSWFLHGEVESPAPVDLGGVMERLEEIGQQLEALDRKFDVADLAGTKAALEEAARELRLAATDRA